MTEPQRNPPARAEQSGAEQSVREGDETDRGRPPEDNSLGRLLALSDGVFAIAMTLLALDLVVPSIADQPDDRALRHILADNIPSYLSFIISFYVVANYWARHREVMKSVVAAHPKLYRDTTFLLLLVAAMPFPSSLLGRYASDGFSLAVYGTFNILATLAVVQIRRDVRLLHLATAPPDRVAQNDERWETVGNLVVFLLCLPAGYMLGGKGPFVLLLLVVAGRGPSTWRRISRALGRRRTGPKPAA